MDFVDKPITLTLKVLTSTSWSLLFKKILELFLALFLLYSLLIAPVRLMGKSHCWSFVVWPWSLKVFELLSTVHALSSVKPLKRLSCRVNCEKSRLLAKRVEGGGQGNERGGGGGVGSLRELALQAWASHLWLIFIFQEILVSMLTRKST